MAIPASFKLFHINLRCFQYNLFSQKLLKPSLRPRASRKRTQAGDEEATLSPTRTTAIAKVPAHDNHRRLNPLHGLEANSNAINDATHLNPKLDRRVASLRRGERRILAPIRPEESAMMKNVQLVNAATLKLATIFLKTFYRGSFIELTHKKSC